MGRRICIVGDVHGRDVWQKIDFTQYDYVVFMGDYFDPYMYDVSYEDRLTIFEDIVNLKGKEPKKYILLFGNHDYHYLVADNPFEKYSRYDPTFAEQYPIQKMFQAGLEAGTLQIAWRVPGLPILFTHAGLSVTWYNRWVLDRRFQHPAPEDLYNFIDEHNLDDVVKKINNLPLEAFGFVTNWSDSYGFNPAQGPLWWRAEKKYSGGFQEEEIPEGIFQINGHTQQYSLRQGTRVALVDILGQGKYVELFDDGEVWGLQEKSIDLDARERRRLQ